MSDSVCGHETAPAGSKFCPGCGAPLSGAPKRDVEVQISQQAETVGDGGMVGLKVGEIEGNVTVVHGNVFHISNPSVELMERLGAVKAISTELKPEPGGQDRAATDRQEVLGKHVTEILQHVRAAEQKGDHIEQVQVGGMQISRVELLLKQVVLIKAEADQMFIDHLASSKHIVERTNQQSTGNPFRVEPLNLMSGFDEPAYTAKLQKAYDLVQEARALEPTNAEVLLHMAQIMSALVLEDREVERVLYQVVHLLDPPRNEIDKFHLAQATFLLGTSSEQTRPDQIRSARDMFAAIGRTDWVRHCDSMLAGMEINAMLDAGQQPDYQAALGQFAQPVPQQQGFQPVGNWQAQMSNGGSMTFQLFPNGAMQGVQQIGLFGMDLNFNGQWTFDQYNRLLQLQGLVGGFTPFVLQIAIQGEQGGAYVGFGSDGQQYMLRQC